ncbi:DUF2326 domain-containing protein [Elizabethkingia meningoseptica]|uniref:DUF2326 domain-containing protein n=1 Tax=Elizabethkingia meningoseptica TaxID=238 RepID=UPI002012D2CD|nr:DUF2326 domain-containing protein [Elizabethkingia meningoseptica]MCL1676466.1 DUF2326 domain-containing protein [Elizabethkingia meningoseptica]MCL1687940.1 DUF2326 domain-containing protein [Elizabethkingia meningoseptica]MDE5437098.1 DUF2326 domain-containing protein [Elizabethkingia meningoseptica]MDE5509771.1 DUF2326 domain-containing protein [Elizabethkingia meningoseptica]MDE5514392.1 DUF2326 domain-containing protein [Elizabethkingia meningoseptica]
MFLKELKINNKSGEIRTIEFRKGLNLIVDETIEYNKQATGNNVGKTTVLRLVDFCLGSSGKNIYQDSEFKKQENSTIKDFLIDTEVIVTLTIVDDLDFPTESIVIKKNFLKYSKKIQEINGESISNDKEFDFKLKELIFKTDVEKPTFKQIISKNIRDEKNKLANIVKVLNPYTKQEEYEALFLFWLGINTITHNQKELLVKEKTREENFQKRLKKEGEISLIEQQLELVNSKITELQQIKSSFNFNEKFDNQIKELNNIKLNLSKFSTEFSRLNMRRELILESKADLEAEKTNIDTNQIELLYSKASKLIPNLQVSFQETVKFHNDLIDEKIKYIEKELPSLTENLKSISKDINLLRKREKELSEFISASEYSDDYDKILIDLNSFFERKGNLEERKKYWITSNKKLERINEDLEDINSGINSKDSLIQKRITLFNKYFTKISNELYGEEYLLSSQKNDKGYDLVVTNIEGNPSTGKKKGQIAAFDFAYILFAQEIEIKFVHFIMHDQLENMHDNQLSTILIDLANSVNCQFILPIVRDKIPENLDIEQYVILRLSEKDKLFKA